MNRPLIVFFALFIALFSTSSAVAENDSISRRQQLIDQFHQYYSRMELDSALLILDKHIAFEAELGNVEKEGNARWNKVAILNNGARYEALCKEAEKQREWFGSHENWSRYYQCWQRMCSANHDQSRIQTALREAKAMANDAQARNNSTGRAMAYKQMGIIYTDIRQLTQAEDAFRKAVELLKEDNDMTGILSGVYEGLSLTLSKQKKFNEQLTVADEWLKHLHALESKLSTKVVSQTFVGCYLSYADAYIGLKNFTEAENAIVKAEEYHAIAKTPLTRYDIFQMRSILEYERGNYLKSLALADSALIPGVSRSVLLEEYRAEALLKSNQANASAELFRKLYFDKDSVFSKEMRIQLDELNTFFQVDELQREKREAKIRYAMIIVGLILAALIVFIIITRRSARKLAEKNKELAENNKALALANDKAEASSRMKTEFIRNMSHEIRTPLNIMNGFTQILASPDADQLEAEEKDDMRKRVEENADRITSLINKMLVLSESNSLTVLERNDRVTVQDIMQQAVTASHAGATPDIAFDVEIADAVKGCELLTSKDYAVRAIEQLLDNAFKFTCQGRVLFTAEKADNSISFIVEDTGKGIPQEDMSRIFDEFVQLDDYVEGTGVGLTMARSIATRLGGSLTVDPAYTNGARFVFSLPFG